MKLDTGTPGKYQSAAKRRAGGRVRPRKALNKKKDKGWLGKQKNKENIEELTKKHEGFGPDTGRGQRDWDYKSSDRGANTKPNKKMKLKAKTKKTSKMPNSNPYSIESYIRSRSYARNHDV